jgi:hypothetical protein
MLFEEPSVKKITDEIWGREGKDALYNPLRRHTILRDDETEIEEARRYLAASLKQRILHWHLRWLDSIAGR